MNPQIVCAVMAIVVIGLVVAIFAVGVLLDMNARTRI